MKITAYYRPPKQVSDIDNKLFKEEINGLSIKRKQDILIIGGDFNFPDISQFKRINILHTQIKHT